MGRYKTEINPKRAERVKTIIEKEGLSQVEFAESIGMTQQNISRIITGKVALTESTARKIINKYPEYRLEWLLDYDNSMTDYEWADKVQRLHDIKADGVWAFLDKSLSKKGLTLKFWHHEGQHLDSTERLHHDCYYTVETKDGKELKRLTAIQIAELEQKFQEYSDFIAWKYLE